MADTNPQQSQQAAPPIEGGDGTPKPSELTEGQINDQQQNPPPAEGAEGTKPPEGADGAEGGEEQPPVNLDEATAYWEAVNKLHGREIKIDFEAAGVKDPLSPEGVFVREKTIWEQAQAEFEETLRATDPRGYNYLLHRRLGGSDEEFMSTTTATLPDKEVLKSDVNLQKTLVRQDLLQRGAIDKDYVDTVIEKMVTDGKLATNALVTYERVAKADEERLLANQKKLDAQQVELQAKLETLSTGLQKTLTEDMKFLVPDTKQSEFLNYVSSSIRQDENGQFVVALPVDSKELKTLMQALYLVHSKGDLAETIKKQAGQQRVERLRSNASQQPGSSGSGAPSKGGKKLTDVW
jgi:hypothetical protein